MTWSGDHAMVWAVSCRPRPLTAEIWFLSLISVHGICGGQWHWDRFLSWYLSVLLSVSFCSFLFHHRNIILATDRVFNNKLKIEMNSLTYNVCTQMQAYTCIYMHIYIV